MLPVMFFCCLLLTVSLGAISVYAQSADIPRNTYGLLPVWQSLADRLTSDGSQREKVEALLSTLPARPTQSPMGRKMRVLYKRKFFPQSTTKPISQHYKGVVNRKNALICQEFISTHADVFHQSATRYQVPASIAAALLFVETRLGKVLGDNDENALYTLASMAVSRKPTDIDSWLSSMPDYGTHLDWITQTMEKRADWAYKETRALIRFLLKEERDPRTIPGSIYGAIGLCQFMPSNISIYGVDGDGDGHIDLFSVSDAVASLSNYLARHGWKKNISRTQKQKVLMRYNKSRIYADTILALADLIEH